MDIRQLAVEETSFLHLRGADDELLYDDAEKTKKVGITLYSPGTKPYAKAVAARNNRAIDRLKKKGKSDLSAEEQTRDTADFLAACTKAFHYIEIEELEGEALFRAVYSDNALGFIPEQANKHLGEWGNFTKGSAKT